MWNSSAPSDSQTNTSTARGCDFVQQNEQMLPEQTVAPSLMRTSSAPWQITQSPTEKAAVHAAPTGSAREQYDRVPSTSESKLQTMTHARDHSHNSAIDNTPVDHADDHSLPSPEVTRSVNDILPNISMFEPPPCESSPNDTVSVKSVKGSQPPSVRQKEVPENRSEAQSTCARAMKGVPASEHPSVSQGRDIVDQRGPEIHRTPKVSQPQPHLALEENAGVTAFHPPPTEHEIEQKRCADVQGRALRDQAMNESGASKHSETLHSPKERSAIPMDGGGNDGSREHYTESAEPKETERGVSFVCSHISYIFNYKVGSDYGVSITFFESKKMNIVLSSCSVTLVLFS